jgi:acyl-CoA thioesterase-1
MRIFLFLWVGFLWAAACGLSQPGQRPVDPAMVPITEVAGLPRVLLIGDSISIGYTLPVRELLRGKANVLRVLENAADSAHGMENMDKWLGEGKWSVIHFNFGLHDLKYLDEKGTYVTPDKGKQVALLPRYEANLRSLVQRLQRTGAKLIWATTTPVPEGSQGRVANDELRYNKVALKVMKEYGIPVDDLHAVIVNGPPGLQQPKNVHFTSEGYELLARSVAATIETALAAK